MNTPRLSTDTHALEARLAARLAGALTTRLADTPHDVTERLRVARQQAVARVSEARRAAPAVAPAHAVIGHAQGAALLGGMMPWWRRAASMLPLIVLVSGLVMIEHWAAREQMLAAADIDTELLADDLPPAAYSDPGFAEFLRTQPSP